MYYYPYLLHIMNILSFTHFNTIDENNISNITNKNTDLWSISRWSYTRYKGLKTFKATYNHYTKVYEFDGKRYLSYDELVNNALQL